MVDAAPGRPGDAGTLYAYRGDPFEQVFQFVGLDTTDWIVNAQLRRRAKSTEVLASFDVDTNYQGDPELVRVSLDEAATSALLPKVLVCDLERREAVDEPRRTMLKWLLDVAADRTRVEED